MKKIVALLMTAVMTIGMATAAFAAPSPQPTTGTIVAGKNASGQDVDLSKVKTSDNYSTNDAPGVEKIKANPQSVLKDAVGAANANGYGLAYVTNITAAAATATATTHIITGALPVFGETTFEPSVPFAPFAPLFPPAAFVFNT